MSYQRFNKGGQVAKSPFLAKSVQKSLNKKNKIDFFKKQPDIKSGLETTGGYNICISLVSLWH